MANDAVSDFALGLFVYSFLKVIPELTTALPLPIPVLAVYSAYLGSDAFNEKAAWSLNIAIMVELPSP